MKLESFGSSSTTLKTDIFRKTDKDMNELFNKCEDKIDDMKSIFEEKIKKVGEKIDEIEIKLIKEINEIKDKIELLEISNNNHIKYYQNLKEDINKINENMVKQPYRRNSIMNNKNNINKNKIMKRKSILRNDKIEELKNSGVNVVINNNKENKVSNINKNINEDSYNNNIINNNTNKNENNIPKLDSEDNRNNEIYKVNSNNNKEKNEENIKNLKDNYDLYNLKKDLKIDVESLNSFNLNKYIMHKTSKKKNDMENNSDSNKRRLILSSIEQEDEKQKSLSHKRKSIKIKNIKNTFNASHHSDESENSKMSLTIVNANNFEMIKSLNILNESQYQKEKEKKNINQHLKASTTDKNIFNKNIKIFKEQNKHWFYDKGKRNIKRPKSINEIYSLNIENNKYQNNLNERYNLIYQRTAKSPTKFKNIILTLEGTKKMIYETKDFHKGKNLYHIESLNDTNKKKSYLRERLESCKSYLRNKLYKNNINSYFLSGKEEVIDFIKYKNNRIIMNKSESSKIYLKNKHSVDYEQKASNINNNLSPSLQVTKYDPPKKNNYKYSEEKSLQTEKNYKNKEIK